MKRQNSLEGSGSCGTYKSCKTYGFYDWLWVLLLLLLPGMASGADACMRRRGEKAVSAFVADPAVAPGLAAVLVTDLKDGSVIASYNADASLLPASILKTVSIATLLREVGPDWRFVTGVARDGKVRDGVLDGNLVIIGGGDPTLGSGAQPPSADIIDEICEALRREGIREIAGRIVIDETVFSGPACPPSWARGDLSRSYGTGCHGFNYGGNASGNASVSDPGARFTTRLVSALKSVGIRVGDRSFPLDGRRHIIAEHVSAPVAEVMRSCMMRSDNLFAESILRTYAVRKRHPGSTAEAAMLETEYWRRKGLPMKGVTIVDGSGLSRSNRVTADFISGVLNNMKDDVDYASFLPLAGQEGTLKKFLAGTPLDSYIALKTGSMNGIQCYAGYKVDEDFAPTHSVVVILNSLPRGRGEARGAVADMLLRIFETPNQEQDNE